jgi:predicted DNA-binding ribbon-helix-helix protein
MATVSATSNRMRHSRGDDPLLVPRQVWIGEHRTSVKLEQEIWDALRRIADYQGVSVHELTSDINHNRGISSLTSAVRAYVVRYLTNALDQVEFLDFDVYERIRS